jgi:hypothetical protein
MKKIVGLCGIVLPLSSIYAIILLNESWNYATKPILLHVATVLVFTLAPLFILTCVVYAINDNKGFTHTSVPPENRDSFFQMQNWILLRSINEKLSHRKDDR